MWKIKWCWMKKIVGVFWRKISIIAKVMVLGNWRKNFRLKPGSWIFKTNWRKLVTVHRSWQGEVVTPPNSVKQLLSKISTNEKVLTISSLVHGCVYTPLLSSNVTQPLNVLFTCGRCQNGRVFHGWRVCEGCYGYGLSWYSAMNIAFVQCFNLIKN